MNTREQRLAALRRLLEERIVLLDGAMGTMIQTHGLDEAAYRGERFADWRHDLRGANDLLNLTQPQIIRGIHRAYLDAGCDIVSTNSFNANAPSLGDYGLEALVGEINRRAASIAREAADAAAAASGRPRFVAGALGPTNRTASLATDVDDPSKRGITFDALVATYREAATALLEGGADILLIETVFDTLNAKAAIYAIGLLRDSLGIEIPVIVSGTITDASGRNLCGQTVEAFWNSVRHAGPMMVGLNCAFGGAQLRPFVAELARVADTRICVYPNAGLPNACGGYDETPEITAGILAEFASAGLVNAVGGCCGTTPAHIAAVAQAVAGVRPRAIPRIAPRLRLAGLEAFTLDENVRFANVGERTNVTGSARFRRLIEAGDYAAALEVAREQVVGGAQIIDVNMDEGMLDSEAVMTRFLHLLAGEPDIARVPVMLDSSRFSVIEAGLKCLPGKAVVNSISLKEGEETFLAQARELRRHGAAVVVMAFDEQGQAETVEHRVAICGRAYGLLTGRLSFPPEDIIFDPNVFAVATGIEAHDGYGLAFIEATRRLRATFPDCHVSGGISNVSFAFRGNDRVREAMHAVFLYHAIAAGLDLGIVNATQLALYDDLPADLRERVEDVILCRRPDATERLLAIAEQYRGGATRAAGQDLAWRSLPVAERLQHALVNGLDEHVTVDTDAAREALGSALAVIEGPLMDGMNEVGDRFGSGRMFLPQVVKSARVMKKAVAQLLPHMQRAGEEAAPSKGRIVLATVKGDVHDIGKNIVGVVLQCNHFEIIDLGVMVPAEKIFEAAALHRADMIGLSGLITPSLDEMVRFAAEAQRRGLTIPLLIGGATTSPSHTSVRIAPEYSGPVVYVKDASRAVGVCQKLITDSTRESYVAEIAAEHERRREQHAGKPSRAARVTLGEARAQRLQLDWASYQPPVPKHPGIRVLDDIPLGELVPFVDWMPFFNAWEFTGTYPALLDDPKRGAAARSLFDDAQQLLTRLLRDRSLRARAVVGLFPANSAGDDIEIYADDSRRQVAWRLPQLRQQKAPTPGQPQRSLADFLAPRESGKADWFGAFAVTAGHGIDVLLAEYAAAHDDYGALLLQALADRLAEAAAEWLHLRVRREWWGYAPDESYSNDELIAERYRGIRPAPGYPACPDHTDKGTLWRMLDVEHAAGMTLTESYAMVPTAAVSGWYFAHPDAHYFTIGTIGEDQLADYARRKELTIEEARRWLAPILPLTGRKT
ncbi:MAG: methionine synthase [Steroidobacteraceae bacterium]